MRTVERTFVICIVSVRKENAEHMLFRQQRTRALLKECFRHSEIVFPGNKDCVTVVLLFLKTL